jgi:hypothetical protein
MGGKRSSLEWRGIELQDSVGRVTGVLDINRGEQAYQFGSVSLPRSRIEGLQETSIK